MFDNYHMEWASMDNRQSTLSDPIQHQKTGLCIKLPKSELKLLAAAALGTVLFSMAAHGFAYFNITPQHDAINHLFHIAGSWEIRLGRFMLPVLALLHFGIYNSWFSGLLCMLNMSVTSYFVCKVCGISKSWAVFLAAGALSANLCLVELTSVFSFLSDAFTLSLALLSAGVYAATTNWRKFRVARFLLVVVLFFLAFGIFQATGAFLVTLFLARACRYLMSPECSAKALCKSIVGWIGQTALAFVLYLATWFCLLKMMSLELVTQRLSYASGLNPATLFEGLKKCSAFIFDTFINPKGPLDWLHAICFIALAILALYSFVKLVRTRKIPVKRVIVTLLLALFMPLAAMSVSIVFGDYGYRLCFGLFIAIPIMLSLIAACELPDSWRIVLERASDLITCAMPRLSVASMVLVVAILGTNVAYSNAAYTTQKIIYDRSLSEVTRVLEEMDNVEGYDSHETPVIFIGNVNKQALLSPIADERFSKYLPGYSKTGISYNQVMARMILNIEADINYCSDADIVNEFKKLDEVKAMPSYPHDGFAKMINGCLVVKFG